MREIVDEISIDQREQLLSFFFRDSSFQKVNMPTCMHIRWQQYAAASTCFSSPKEGSRSFYSIWRYDYYNLPIWCNTYIFGISLFVVFIINEFISCH